MLTNVLRNYPFEMEEKDTAELYAEVSRKTITGEDMDRLCQNALIRPRECALIVVDVQYDFIDGSLRIDKQPAKQDGLAIIPVINKLFQQKFAVVIMSRDWHPAGHISFHENLSKWELSPSFPIQEKSKIEMFTEVPLLDLDNNIVHQTLWPSHCVMNSRGAMFHEELQIPRQAMIINKGSACDVESYSAFGLSSTKANTGLHEKLKAYEVNTVFVCGIATDVCVYYTCMDALRLGYRVVLVSDACAGLNEETIKACFDILAHQKASVNCCSEVERMLKGKLVPGKFLLQEVMKN